jgi:hypothetical protein
MHVLAVTSGSSGQRPQPALAAQAWQWPGLLNAAVQSELHDCTSTHSTQAQIAGDTACCWADMHEICTACAAVQACGNTFATLNPELSPKVSLNASSISFPACHPGEAVHQTLCLTNHGDTPVHFAFSARASTASHHGPASASRLNATAAAGGEGAVAAVASSSSGACVKAGFVAAGGAWFGQFAVLPVQGVLEPKSQQLVSMTLESRHCSSWFSSQEQFQSKCEAHQHCAIRGGLSAGNTTRLSPCLSYDAATWSCRLPCASSQVT